MQTHKHKDRNKKTQTDVFIKAKALLEKRQMCGQWHCIGEVNREEKTVHTVRYLYLTRERKHCELHTVSLTLYGQLSASQILQLPKSGEPE